MTAPLLLRNRILTVRSKWSHAPIRMIEDRYAVDASAEEVRAYLGRRHFHLEELRKMVESTVADIASAERRIQDLLTHRTPSDPPV